MVNEGMVSSQGAVRTQKFTKKMRQKWSGQGAGFQVLLSSWLPLSQLLQFLTFQYEQRTLMLNVRIIISTVDRCGPLSSFFTRRCWKRQHERRQFSGDACLIDDHTETKKENEGWIRVKQEAPCKTRFSCLKIQFFS